MERFSQSLVSKITQLQKRFESLLEEDIDKKHEEARTALSFEPSQDLSLIRGISLGLPENHIDRAIIVFSRLALLFDAGVLLENHDGTWKAQARFSQGHSQLIKSQTKTPVILPSMTLLSILKTASAPMLEKLQLTELDPQNRTSCLVLKVSPDFAFILFSKLPDIWLKNHIENVRKELLNGFAEA